MFYAWIQVIPIALIASLGAIIIAYRKQAKRLLDAAELMGKVHDALPDAIFILDGDRRISRASHATQNLFRYASQDIQGKDFSLLVSPGRGDSGGPALRQALHLSTDSACLRCEVECRCADEGVVEAESAARWIEHKGQARFWWQTSAI